MEIKVRTEDIYKYGFIDACLLGYLRENPRTTKKEIMFVLGLSETTVRTHLRNLREQNAVEVKKAKVPTGLEGVRGCGCKKKIVRVDVL